MDNSEEKQVRHGHSRIWLALILVGVGGVLLFQQLGFDIPYWILSWQMLLIVLGIVRGFTNGFRGPGWLILIFVGSVFLLNDLIPGFSMQKYTWPVVIIAVGLFMLIRPRHYGPAKWDEWNNKWKRKEEEWRAKGKSWGHKYANPTGEQSAGQFSSEDYFDSTSIFGGTKKVILSKNFKFADITCVMGGCDVDFSQADIQGEVIIDMTVIFGGVKLTVPPNWTIRNNLTPLFGNTEDKRTITATNYDTSKVLILTGGVVFGGIEIRSF